MFVSKAGFQVLHSRVGSWPYPLESHDRDEHSSLLPTLVNYTCKKIYETGPGGSFDEKKKSFSFLLFLSLQRLNQIDCFQQWKCHLLKSNSGAWTAKTFTARCNKLACLSLKDTCTNNNSHNYVWEHCRYNGAQKDATQAVLINVRLGCKFL